MYTYRGKFDFVLHLKTIYSPHMETCSETVFAANPNGTYEIHCTVGPLDPSEEHVARFKAFCAVHKLKPIDVGVLYQDGFKRFLQTARYVCGNLKYADAIRQEHARLLRGAGFEVIREKIESIAATFEELPSELYYENHIVVEVPTDYMDGGVYHGNESIATLQHLGNIFNEELIVTHEITVPLSFNLKHTDRRECFVTVRQYGCTRDDNDRYIKACLLDLDHAGFKVIKVIREAVVYDTNNWVDAEPAQLCVA